MSGTLNSIDYLLLSSYRIIIPRLCYSSTVRYRSSYRPPVIISPDTVSRDIPGRDTTAVTVPTQASQASELANQDRENVFLKWHKQKKGPSPVEDEYTVYLKAPVLIEVTDARSWWLEPTQRKTYPNLSIMAFNILSIPAMSAEPERLFSSCKITITDRRNQLGIESIEALECIKSWMCKGSIPYVDDLGLRSVDHVLNTNS
jgi:hypothetical protein